MEQAREGREPEEKSFGNISDAHWSRARSGANAEAMDYYRQRSKAPGVKEGGGPRNFYCMECDGVVPDQPGLERCPHCQASLAGMARRYFNWVEINEPSRGDAAAVLKPIAATTLVVLALALLAWWLW
ncbi:MAG: hypothetical protein RL112_1523 [Planctomycetota bacterium]